MVIRRSANPRRVNRMVPQRNFPDEGLISIVLPELLLENGVIPEPDARPWDEQVKDLLAALVTALRVHPDASFAYLCQILQADTLTVADRMLDLLLDAGFALDAAADTAGQAFRSLVTLVIAAPIRTHGGNVDVVDAAIRVKKAALSALDPRRYPHIVAAADALARSASQEDYYERGIRLIVASIRRSHSIREDGRVRRSQCREEPTKQLRAAPRRLWRVTDGG